MSFANTNSLIALADCNNFYASCERCFNPSLLGKAIVILSNNDGCVIARSAEAKALGIKMGVPFFEIRQLVQEHGIFAYSSNFPLYGDLSARVMHLLESHAKEIEIYSIDEAFFTLPPLNSPLTYCHAIRKQVGQCTGVPISIGLANTKTLAKVAAAQAKKSSGSFFLETSNQEQVLRHQPIQDVWGIGRRLTKRLMGYGIHYAWDLYSCDDQWLLKRFGVCVLRTCHELRGIPSLALESQQNPKQSIRVSRTFPKIVTTLSALLQELSFFAERACQKLRQEQEKALYIDIFIEGPYPTRKHSSLRCYLDEPSDYTPDFLAATEEAGRRLFSRQEIRKAGVTLHRFSSKEAWQQEFFSKPRDHHKQNTLMQEFDAINQKFGQGSLRFLSSGKREFPRGTRLSPRYTTSWNDLALVK